jgi:chromosomal replication initiation ATPase DnaA
MATDLLRPGFRPRRTQFLAGEESTHDEFFHSFNALHENHKLLAVG